MKMSKLGYFVELMNNKNDYGWEFDSDIYKGNRKFRLCLTNKDSCLEERKNKGYMKMGGVGLKYFKKLCINDTENCEELINEDLNNEYNDYINSSNKKEEIKEVISEETVEMLDNNKDLIKLMIKGFEKNNFLKSAMFVKFVYI